MKKAINILFIFTIVLLTSCKKDIKTKESAPTNKTNLEETKVKGSDFSLEKKWETSGFKMPESVFASPNHKWLYVSNVNGAKSGFISRVSKDGIIDNLEWVTGLGAPTGSDIYDDRLYVADSKKLHVINLEKRAIIKSYTADGAGSLNDVAINKKTGQVFISDVPAGKVYTLKNDQLIVWLQVPEIPFPNGVFVENNTLIIANYGKKKWRRFNEETMET